MHGLMSYRCFGRARLLRSDRAWLELGRYVSSELNGRSVATLRPSLARARSLHSDRAGRTLHSDRAGRTLGHYIATELGTAFSSGCSG
ncbi:hypothetical protein F2Q70_00011704 [Brassica cretica]|nr:hypothetical protein F2Q70_00011704 [Brassica cretica]KAF3547189.1 hypothetical protein DY000_02007131 [Brassica cretica]